MCTSTVTPLFLVLILGLYAASAVTNSQTIASIGLVYVFVFLVIMGSYFFAIVPFILASTIISNQISPRGKSTEKFSTRIFLLIAAIAAVITYYKYGLPSMG